MVIVSATAIFTLFLLKRLLAVSFLFPLFPLFFCFCFWMEGSYQSFLAGRALAGEKVRTFFSFFFFWTFGWVGKRGRSFQITYKKIEGRDALYFANNQVYINNQWFGSRRMGDGLEKLCLQMSWHRLLLLVGRDSHVTASVTTVRISSQSFAAAARYYSHVSKYIYIFFYTRKVYLSLILVIN